jgi:uncharacterized Ntn-hydrolase superfamily protein
MKVRSTPLLPLGVALVARAVSAGVVVPHSVAGAGGSVAWVTESSRRCALY